MEAEINLALGNTFYALAKSVSGDLSDTESDEYKQKSQYIETALNYYQQTATDGVSRDTSIQGKLNQLRLQVGVGKWSAAQNLWQEIQPQLANLAPSRKNIYARINLAQSLTCLKQGTDGTAKVITFSCPEFNGDRQKNLQVTDGIPWKTIYQVVETAVQDAEALKDTRSYAYALGTLGSLYEQTKQWKEAQTITQRAISIAEGIQASDITYRWEWQLGRILKEQGKEKEKSAIAAYGKAVNHLKSLRRDLALLNRDVQFSFRQEVEPVYREYVSLLLRSHQQESNAQRQQEILREARDVMESLKIAELDNFFRRACLDDTTEVALDQIDRQASVIYPIILPDSLAVITSLPNENLRKQIQSFSPSIISLATHGTFGSRAEDTFILSWDKAINVNDVDFLLKNQENQSNIIDLLVLSACQTASGDDRAALGLAGVAIQSGARSTVATLWSVDDSAASELIIEFFNQLNNNPNINKAEALKNAQLKLLKGENTKLRHPFYWSPYILVGNWL